MSIHEEYEKQRLKDFLPFTTKKRGMIIEAIIQRMREKGLKGLDESNPDHLKQVIAIVSDISPLTIPRTARDYARVAILLSKKQKPHSK